MELHERTARQWADWVLSVPGYEVAEVIGQGGYATVHRATQVSVGRTVALKVLTHLDLDGTGRRRFLDECQALGALSWHPNIVVVHDAGLTPDGVPFLAMELVQGGALSEQLEDGPLSMPEVLSVGVSLAGALEAAHRAGVIHRDVKPDNILLGAVGDPKLADFGIAAPVTSSRTSSQSITATVAHASPEVLDGSRATARSDVYSLASTMHALLAGSAPFSRDTDESWMAAALRVASQPAPDLRAHGVADTVATIIESGLHKDPAARPATAQAFGTLLQAAQQQLQLDPTPMRVDQDEILCAPGPSRSPVTRLVPALELPTPGAGPGASPRRPRRRLGAAAATGAALTVAFVAATALPPSGDAGARSQPVTERSSGVAPGTTADQPVDDADRTDPADPVTEPRDGERADDVAAPHRAGRADGSPSHVDRLEGADRASGAASPLASSPAPTPPPASTGSTIATSEPGPEPAPTPAPAPPELERAQPESQPQVARTPYEDLLEVIPSAIRPSCVEHDDGADFPGEVVEARCRAAGATIFYQRYSTATQARHAWDRVSGASLATGPASTGVWCNYDEPNHEGPYQVSGADTGTARCLVRDGRAEIQWTNDAQRVFAWAVHPQSSQLNALLDAWVHFGPRR